MPAPCSTAPTPPVTPSIHKLVAVHRHLTQLGHHVWHRVHHAVHTLSANSTACQVLPQTLAAIGLGVIAPPPTVPPLRFPTPTVIEPMVLSPDDSSIGITGLGIGFGGGLLAPAPAVSTAPVDPAAGTAPGPLGSPVSSLMASEVLAQPSMTQMPYPTATDPAPTVMAVEAAPAGWSGQSVPEPSSLAILAAAACFAGLMKRRSSGRRSAQARKRAR